MSAIGMIMAINCGMAKKIILRKTNTLWRWSTITSRAERLSLSSATPKSAPVARSVGPSSSRNK